MNWTAQLWVPVVGELDSTVDRCQLLVNWIAQLWVPILCVCVNWIAQVVADKKQEEKEREKKRKRQTKSYNVSFNKLRSQL